LLRHSYFCRGYKGSAGGEKGENWPAENAKAGLSHVA
jgi:hypothetical protein